MRHSLPDRPIDPQTHAAIAMAVLAFAALYPVFGPRFLDMAIEMVAPGIGPTLANSDFVNYWFGGKLLISGEYAVLFDPQAYYRLLQSHFGEQYDPHNWSYPPHALLIFAPLGLLGYKAAMSVFLLASMMLFLFAAFRFQRRYAPTASVPLFIAAMLSFIAANIVTTQNGFLTAGLMLLFLSDHDRRPIMAAAALAVLTIKPQLGILIPFFLLFSRAWLTLALACLFSLALIILSAILLGLDPWFAYVETVMPFQRLVMTQWEGTFLAMMPTLVASLRLLGMEGETALIWQMAYSSLFLPLALIALWRWRNAKPLPRAFVFVTATICVTPYSFNYDMGALVVVAAVLLAAGQTADTRARTALWVVCLFPACVMFLAVISLPVSPLILVALFVIACRIAADSSETEAGADKNVDRPAETGLFDQRILRRTNLAG